MRSSNGTLLRHGDLQPYPVEIGLEKMNLVSFNINGIRARLHQVNEVLRGYSPFVVGLQEVKVADEQFPFAELADTGYHIEVFGQKGHYGVGLLAKTPPIKVERGFPWDPPDAQRRFIVGHFDTPSGPLTVLNGYFPQGDSRAHEVKYPGKAKFFSDMSRYLREHCDPRQPLVLMGDINVSHTDLDVGIGEENRLRWLKSGKCSFLPEERAWLDELIHWGLHDTYREHHPGDASKFSWFDYRTSGFERDPPRGLRIDVVLATAPVLAQSTGAGIDYDVRGMIRPSDHCPVWVELSGGSGNPVVSVR